VIPPPSPSLLDESSIASAEVEVRWRRVEEVTVGAVVPFDAADADDGSASPVLRRFGVCD